MTGDVTDPEQQNVKRFIPHLTGLDLIFNHATHWHNHEKKNTPHFKVLCF